MLQDMGQLVGQKNRLRCRREPGLEPDQADLGPIVGGEPGRPIEADQHPPGACLPQQPGAERTGLERARRPIDRGLRRRGARGRSGCETGLVRIGDDTADPRRALRLESRVERLPLLVGCEAAGRRFAVRRQGEPAGQGHLGDATAGRGYR